MSGGKTCSCRSWQTGWKGLGLYAFRKVSVSPTNTSLRSHLLIFNTSGSQLAPGKKKDTLSQRLYRTWVSLIQLIGLISKTHFNLSVRIPRTQFLLSRNCFLALSLCLTSFLQTDTRRQENMFHECLLCSHSSLPLWAAPWKAEAAWPWHLRLNHSPVPPLNPHLRSSFERKVSSIWRLFRERLNHLMMSHVKIKLMQMLIWQPESLERIPAGPQALC